MSRIRKEEEQGFPISLTYYRPLLQNEFLNTLNHIPHLLLLPLKANTLIYVTHSKKFLGLLFVPLHWYVGKRIEATKRKKAPGAVVSKKTKDKQTISFMVLPLMWIHEVSEPRMNFWGM
jgi:hypothetical protein